MRGILLLILALIIPLASSISTTMLPAYQPSDTMIIEIQGNILEPITPQDIVFKRAHVAIAVDYDVKRIGDKYYLYAQLPINPNNYTLFINDIDTTVNGQAQVIDYNQTFQVIGNTSEYSINPGFIVTDKDFTLTVTSYLDQSLPINLNFPSESSFTLQPGNNPILFRVISIEAGLYLAAVGKYIVPIQITSAQSNSTPSQITSASISPLGIRQIILANQNKTFEFRVTNLGSTQLENLYFSFDETLFSVYPPVINTLAPNSSQQFNLSLKRTSGQLISGKIFLAQGSKTLANLTVDISFTDNQSIANASTTPQYYCSELSGKFCAATETCSTVFIQSLDGSCCTGECQTNDPSSSSNWIVYSGIILVLVILFVVYMSYKKSKFPKMNKPSPLSPPFRTPA